MVHGNIAAQLMTCSSPGTCRCSGTSVTLFHSKQSHDCGPVRLMAYTSSRARWILYNSHASALKHEALGYDPRRTLVIPNGFDCSAFRPMPNSASIRNELGYRRVPLIGWSPGSIR